MSLFRDAFLGPTLAIVDPGRAAKEMVRTRVVGGLYLISAVTTTMGGIAAVRLAFTEPSTSDIGVLTPQSIYQIGLGGALAAGVIVPIVVPFVAAFFPWLTCEFSGKQSSYSAHVHVLMVAAAPALILGNLASFLVETLTGTAFDSSARLLLTGSTSSSQLLGYLDVFLHGPL